MANARPTSKELDQKANDIVAELENTPEVPEKVEEELEKPQEEKPKKTSKKEKVEAKPEEKEEPKEEEPKEPEKPEEDEEKKKLKHEISSSARENQKILAKNRVINKAFEEADEIAEPTDEEMEKKYKDWDVMTDFERRMARRDEVNERRWTKIREARKQGEKIEKWNDDVDAFVEDPKTFIENPELEGKEEEFRQFAKQEGSNNVPFKYLVGSFLHDRAKTVVKHKGTQIERGVGGPNVKYESKSEKLTVEEGAKLRTTNYNLWKQKVRAGLIDIEI